MIALIWRNFDEQGKIVMKQQFNSELVSVALVKDVSGYKCLLPTKVKDIWVVLPSFTGMQSAYSNIWRYFVFHVTLNLYPLPVIYGGYFKGVQLPVLTLKLHVGLLIQFVFSTQTAHTQCPIWCKSQACLEICPCWGQQVLLTPGPHA